MHVFPEAQQPLHGVFNFAHYHSRYHGLLRGANVKRSLFLQDFSEEAYKSREQADVDGLGLLAASMPVHGKRNMPKEQICGPRTIALCPALLAASTLQPCRNAILLLSVSPLALLLPLDFNPVEMQFFYSQLKEEHTSDNEVRRRDCCIMRKGIPNHIGQSKASTEHNT